MTPDGRTLSTGALLMLGVADLAFLNVWVFPRTSLPERLTRAMSAPVAASVAAPVAAPVVATMAVAVERPPVEPPPPAARPAVASARAVSARTRVLFAHNQHALSPEAARALATLIRRRGPVERIVIEGHADSTGVEVYNSWLSQQRAETVAGALAALGVGRQQMELRAYGSRRPAVDGEVTSALRRNRRVEISIIGEVTRER